MRLSLDKTQQFPVPGDGDGASITVRALSLEEISEAESSSTELKMDDFNGATMVLDTYKRVNAIARKCLVDWTGFFEANGTVIQFSRKNDKKLAHLGIDIAGKKMRFLEWVDNCHNELQEKIKEEAEQAEEN